MLVGIITGTYSTIYIAAPLVLWLQEGAAAARREQQQMSRSTPQATA
jgi:preprotein translocase subunit SecF